MEKRPPATSAATSLLSSNRSCFCARPRSRFISILNNLSVHKTQPSEISSSSIREFRFTSPPLTPTYSFWLNRVEIWFAKIEREVIARGIFTSVPDLARKLGRYINAYSVYARPIQWKYSDLPVAPH